MKKVNNFYLVETKYGINTIAELYSGEYYQQEHRSLSYDGGGAAVWVKLEIDGNKQPIILNKES